MIFTDKNGNYVSWDLNDRKILQRLPITELFRIAMSRRSGLKQALIEHILTKKWD
jgi:hypothetical protein